MARMSIDDKALRDPRMLRVARTLTKMLGPDIASWPQFARRYALGTLLDVWAVSYDQVTDVLVPEDIDTAAEIEDFHALMVKESLAEYSEAGVRIRGASHRVRYGKDDSHNAHAQNGRKGGLASGKARLLLREGEPSADLNVMREWDETQGPDAPIAAVVSEAKGKPKRSQGQAKPKPLRNGFAGDPEPSMQSSDVATAIGSASHKSKPTRSLSVSVSGSSSGSVSERERVKPRAGKNPPLPSGSDKALAFFADLVHRASNGARVVSVKSMPKQLRRDLDAKVAEHGEAAVHRAMSVAVTSPPSWPAGPWSLAMVVRHFDLLTPQEHRQPARDARVGQVEPSRSDQYDDRDPFNRKKAKEAMPWED
jgi:hypothetical protein